MRILLKNALHGRSIEVEPNPVIEPLTGLQIPNTGWLTSQQVAEVRRAICCDDPMECSCASSPSFMGLWGEQKQGSFDLLVNEFGDRGALISLVLP